MQNVDRIAVWLLLIVMTGPSSAVEPSPIVATGVISEAYGADSSNWDTPPYNAYSFTETDHIFPTLLISPGQKSASTLTYAEQQLNLSKFERFSGAC